MNGCRRRAVVVLILSVVALAAAGLGAWLKLTADSYFLGVLVGFGVGGLLAGTVLWFWPGDPGANAPPALARRYYRDFFPPMAGYVAVMLGWRRLLGVVEATWLRVLVALLPAVLLALVIRAMMRYVRDSDEMQRRIELESIAIAAGLVSTIYMTLGFLQNAKLIAVRADTAMLWVFPALCALYGLVKLFITRRYA
ncbi:MAG: hypothetical protein QM761_14365 [Pseudoxanthomonas sp.]